MRQLNRLVCLRKPVLFNNLMRTEIRFDFSVYAERNFMTREELRNLRLRIKFDVRSMALCVGVPASTYQRYEDGSAAVPLQVERAALELEQINTTFIQGLPRRVDAAIEIEFPKGIRSEIS
jgi:hypothetical protein